MGEEDREKGEAAGNSNTERESERKGQTPQQQAWETSLIARDLENSHNRRAQRERPLSRDVREVEWLFIMWR